MAEQQPAPAGEQNVVQFSVDRIYVKDLSLENPGSPQSFQMTEPPQVEVGLRSRTDVLAPDVYECVLTVTVTAKAGDRTIFLAEAAQAGIFTIKGVPADQMQPVIAIPLDPESQRPHPDTHVVDPRLVVGSEPIVVIVSASLSIPADT